MKINDFIFYLVFLPFKRKFSKQSFSNVSWLNVYLGDITKVLLMSKIHNKWCALRVFMFSLWGTEA